MSITSDELSSILASSRGSSVNTQPPPSTARDIEKAMEKFQPFHPVHLSKFLQGYLSGRAHVAEEALSNIRQLSLSADRQWLYQCQLLALQQLLCELELRCNGVVPETKPGESLLLPQLRRGLAEYQGKAPRITVSNCHFLFVGDANAGSQAQGKREVSAEISLKNGGDSKCVVKVSEVHTFIDGEAVPGDYLGCAGVKERTLCSGEAIAFHLALKPIPRHCMSLFEAVAVLTIDTYVKVFITFTVVSEKQRPFGTGFPQWLPITVRYSPVGVYTCPLVLQLLKHQFIRQQGLTSKTVARFLVGKSRNFTTYNREVMREATRVKEILEEELDFAEVLATYRSSLPQNSWGNTELPHSSAQPAGYPPGGVLPTAVAAVSSMSCFPNAATRLPTALTNAQPDILMGLILIWLAELEATMFEASLFTHDPMTYLGVLPPHLRGVIFWIVDFCGGLLLHQSVNEVSVRHLALTFAAVLMRKKRMPDEGRADIVFMETVLYRRVGEPWADTMLADVALHQAAANAFVHWITVYSASYKKYSSQ
ncbi:hypothetical protein TRSC58_02890 [Trypanosoma rangeli SC58]|uniref:Uncharacterized protein n=1 Tax=Trypanosoma rangeli SC58 TaxID=429131 RepID=A0A061J7W2_TRYRA|nr:hypothetical protein TRSC58_02890 [Trypanosoma rangeli SC58]